MDRSRDVPDDGAATRADALPDARRRLVLSPVPAVHLPNDLAQYVVLTPNPRAAAALPGDIAFASLASKANSILEALGTRVADAFLGQRTLLHAVTEETDASDPVGTAAVMAPRVRELLRAGLDEAVLNEAVLNEAVLNESVLNESVLDEGRLGERTRRLLAVTRRYRALLREAEPRPDAAYIDAAYTDAAYIDAAEAAWVAARAVQPSQQLRLCVVGYPQVGRGEYALIDALAAPGSLVVLPSGNDEAAEVLGAAGWRVERPHAAARSVGERLALRFHGAATLDDIFGSGDGSDDDEHGFSDGDGGGEQPGAPTGDAAGVDVWRFPSQEAEVRHVLAVVKAMLHAGVPTSEIVLSTRDEASYGPLLRAIAWEYEVPLATSYAVPLTDTRAGAWFAGLAEVLNEEAPFEATARLLAHPLGAGLPLGVWRRARRERPNDLAAWRALDQRLNTLDWPAGRVPRPAWRDRLLELMIDFDLDASDAADAIALQRLRAAIQWVGAAESETITGAGFLADVLGLLPHLRAPRCTVLLGSRVAHTPGALRHHARPCLLAWCC